MKIKTLLIYFCIFVNATLLAATPPEYWSDVATKKPDYCSSCNYYKITTPEELAYLSSTPISGTFYIANDLDMSGKLWKPITTKGDLFIYGGGHTISNLTINETTPTSNNVDQSIGFVASMTGGSISDLHLEDESINVNFLDSFTANVFCGGIVGSARDGVTITLTNCSVVNGSFSATKQYQGTINNDVGGILGNGNANISNCFTTGNFSSLGSCGGIVSWLNKDKGSVSQCVSLANVHSDKMRAGGIVAGCGGYAKVFKSVFAGSVTADVYKPGMGAIVGGIQSNKSQSNYYDVQRCPVNAFSDRDKGTKTGYDVKNKGEGKTTADLTGSKLSSFLGTIYWTYEDGFYPRPKDIATRDAVLAAAAAIYFDASTTSATPDGIRNGSKYDIRLGGTDKVTWSFSPKKYGIIISDSLFVLPPEDANEEVTYTATKGNYSRSITVPMVKAVVIKAGETSAVTNKLDNNLIVYPTSQASNTESFAVKGRIFYKRPLENCDYWHTVCFPFNVDRVTIYDSDDDANYVIRQRTAAEDAAKKVGGNFFLKYYYNNGNQTAANFKTNGWYATSGKICFDSAYIFSFPTRVASYYNGKTMTFFGPKGAGVRNDFTVSNDDGSYNYFYANCNISMKALKETSAYVLDFSSVEQQYFVLTQNPTVYPFDYTIQSSDAVKTIAPRLDVSLNFDTGNLGTATSDSQITIDDDLLVVGETGVMKVQTNSGQLVSIFNMQGKLMATLNSTMEIQTVSLPAGTYVVKCKSGAVKKAIVK